MALFPRRIVQRELDFFRRHGLSDQHLNHFIGRLNSGTRHALAAEWEVLLLGAFARHADIEYEPNIGKGRPDLLAKIAAPQGGHENVDLIADIVTVSDFGIHERNPVSYLFENACYLAMRMGIDFSRCSVEIGDNSRGPKIPGGRVQLLLPSKNRINAFLAKSVRPLFLQIRNKPSARHELHWIEPGVNCRFVYDPACTPSKSHLSPTVAYSATNNHFTNRFFGRQKS